MAEKKEEFSLLNYLDELVDQLRGLSIKAVTGNDPDAVHDARVSTRRLKAALELLTPLSGEAYHPPLVKISRVLRRRLGPLRDLDVMLEHLAPIKAARLQPAVTWARGWMEEARSQALAKAAEDLPAPKVLEKLGNWWGLRQEILPSHEAVGSFLSESVHLQLDAFAEQAGGLINPVAGHDPHQLRIVGKSLRYTLEMAKAHGFRLPRPVLAGFKRIQTALGLWHDYVVLSDRVLCQASAELLAYHDPARQHSVLALAMAMLRRAEQQLARVADFWRLDGPELVQHIRESFPLTAPAEAPAVEKPPTAELIQDPHTAPP